MLWIKVESLLKIIVSQIYHADLHASSSSIHVVLGIVCKEVNSSAKFYIGALIVLLIEALGTQRVMCQR